MLDRVGLLNRVAYWCVLKVGGSYYGMLYGIFIVGCILSVATGGNAWIIMAAFVFGICKAFKLGVSIDSAIIMMVGAFAASFPLIFFYTPYFISLLFAGGRTVDPSLSVGWWEYFFHMCPYLVYSIFMIWVLPKIFKPKQKLPAKEYFQAEYAKCGKMSRDEKKAGAVTLFLIIFMMTGSIHGVPLDWAFAVIPWFLSSRASRSPMTRTSRR